jgi:hypothetical protein
MNTLPRGGRPDILSEDSRTGLQVAQQLLEAGANPNIQLKLRPPYRNYIFDRGGDQVLSTGATALMRAAKGGDIDAVKLLIAHKANIELPNEDGITPLMVAAGMGHGANEGAHKISESLRKRINRALVAGLALAAVAKGLDDRHARLLALHALWLHEDAGKHWL